MNLSHGTHDAGADSYHTTVKYGELPLEDLRENIRTALSAPFTPCSYEITDQDGVPITLFSPVSQLEDFYAAVYPAKGTGYCYELVTPDTGLIGHHAPTERGALNGLLATIRAHKGQ